MRSRQEAIGERVKTAAQAVRRHKPDYQIVLYMGLLMLIGLIVIYAIGPQRANLLNMSYGGTGFSDSYFFVKQLTSLLLAMGAFAALALIPYRFVQKYGGKILLAGFIACALLFIFGNLFKIGCSTLETLGACRWFDLGPLGSIQPAEILKFGMLIFFASFLGMRAKQGLINDLHKTLIPFGIAMALALFVIVVLQKDLGTGISLTGIMASMLMVAGLNKKIGLIILGVAVLGGILMIVTADHRLERIATFFQGDSTTTSDPNAYHITQAKIAIGTGGVFGVGIGSSVQATGYLPEAVNDSVFAIMGEMFGFVGLVAVMGLFVGLLLRLLKVADHLMDMRLKLIIAGVFGWLAVHIILNIGAMVGLIPLTGITLPLVSFGGTSMIFIASALGLAFQLSRYTTHQKAREETNYEDLSSRRGVGRSRHTSRRRTPRT